MQLILIKAQLNCCGFVFSVHLGPHLTCKTAERSFTITWGTDFVLYRTLYKQAESEKWLPGVCVDHCLSQAY